MTPLQEMLCLAAVAQAVLPITRVPDHARNGLTIVSDHFDRAEALLEPLDDDAERATVAARIFYADYYAAASADSIDAIDEIECGPDACWPGTFHMTQTALSHDALDPLPQRKFVPLHDEYDAVMRLRECHTPFGDAECPQRVY